ncbi:FAD-dependent monooxygenase [Haloferax chudinovii]|uniref:FAD-dependent monooxygenase n=1 Tax=Haloferax chudinovii TaxID=1109010 RepID=A0ABD5XG86_9EURY
MTDTVRYGTDLHILVVGGGIAGLTCAGLLEQRGFSPDVVEKTDSYGGLGYALGLWPAGSNILKGLGTYEAFASHADPMNTYTLLSDSGNELHSYDLRPLADEYGEAQLIWRPRLINVLRETVSDETIRMGTTVTDLHQHDDVVDVSFSDGTEDTYDVVVGADGIHSAVREMVFGEISLNYAGMTSWAFWVDEAMVERGVVKEHWGDGRFAGLYPTDDGLACFLAVTAPEGTPDPLDERKARIQKSFEGMGEFIPEVLDELETKDAEDIWHDDFYDLRMDEWTNSRVVLIGDAGHAPLPTAGVGASLAMEDAAVLTDELARTDSTRLDQALDHYVARRRKRVDEVQEKSRRLGTFALFDHSLLTAVRDQVVKFYSQERMENYFRDFLSSEI